MPETLVIEGIESKTSSKGTPYHRVKANGHWFSVFGKDSAAVANLDEGVEIEAIRARVGLPLGTHGRQ
jgi:hypothetical protein